MLFIWYPKCSTCQKAKAWLDARGAAYQARAILSRSSRRLDELRKWYKMSGMELNRFFNTSGMLYKEMKLKDRLPTMTEDEQLALLATDGMLVNVPLMFQEIACCRL